MDKEEMVKVTIRLPKSLARLAKHHAVARDEDLQDLVAEALALYLKQLPPAMDAAEGRRLLKAMFGTMTPASKRRLANSYGGKIKTKGPRA
jgi:hypothetical protein